MDDAGKFTHGWTDETIEAPAPEIAYGNTDVWFGGAPQAFIGAVLSGGKLNWFQSSAAGLEHPILVSIGKAARLYTSNHTQAEAMAEWALWAALDFLREGPAHRAQQAERSYDRIESREVNGSRWLVIGFGAIGNAVGRRVRALGGYVTGVRRSGGASDNADEIITPDRMMPALGEADIVLLSAPHTEETEGMVNSDFLKAMQADAALLNLGRGALVVEDDLIAALDAGRPAFAALDVQAVEPLPEDSALWTHPKILITPHDSADTPQSKPRTDETFLANLARYLAGEPLENIVSKESFVELETGFGRT